MSEIGRGHKPSSNRLVTIPETLCTEGANHDLVYGKSECIVCYTEGKQNCVEDNTVDSKIMPMWALDLTGVFTFISKECADMGGYTQEELIFNPCLMLIPVYLIDLFFHVLNQVSKGKTWRGPFTWMHKDGHLITRNFVVVPSYDKEGKIVGIQGYIENSVNNQQFAANHQIENAITANDAYSHILETLTTEVIKEARINYSLRKNFNGQNTNVLQIEDGSVLILTPKGEKFFHG